MKSGDKESKKIEGQKMTLWVRKDHKGCFNNNPIPVPTCWIEENDIFKSISGGLLDHSLKNGAMDESGFLGLPREKLQNSKRFFSCGLAEPPGPLKAAKQCGPLCPASLATALASERSTGPAAVPLTLKSNGNLRVQAPWGPQCHLLLFSGMAWAQRTKRKGICGS